jgi:lysophospholipase L1-like esterase
LLEDLHDFRWADPAGLADQLVNMFGHNDVPYEGKAVPGANFLENLHRQISGADRAEQRAALIAAKGDEMQVAVAGETFEFLRHRSEERPTFCELRKR